MTRAATLSLFAIALLAAGAAGGWQQPPARPIPPVSPLPAPAEGLPPKAKGDIELIPESVLEWNLLVTWYGNPRSNRMGILGEYRGEALAEGLREQARAYQGLTPKRVMPAYELIATVATNTPGRDGMWRRRETADVIERMLQEARANKFKLILDVQVGHSTVPRELEYLRKYVEEPDVYVALDPEFHMWEGQTPGRQIGHTLADDVNYTIGWMDRIIRARNLPPKVLIVHQFTLNMLPDKEKVKDSPLVDVALDMDGWGGRELKVATYRMVTRKPLEYLGIKLFYRKDTRMLMPAEVLALKPLPSVVVYQ